MLWFNPKLHCLQDICEKTTTKEREAFDVREQRLDGTEANKYKVNNFIIYHHCNVVYKLPTPFIKICSNLFIPYISVNIPRILSQTWTLRRLTGRRPTPTWWAPSRRPRRRGHPLLRNKISRSRLSWNSFKKKSTPTTTISSIVRSGSILCVCFVLSSF